MILARLRRAGLLARTMLDLGPGNVSRVAAYRFRLATGQIKRRLPVGQAYAGPFLGTVSTSLLGAPTLETYAFSRFAMRIPPASGWHSNCLTGAMLANSDRHWTDIPDFGTGIGDIKTVWEASRFDWLPLAALHADDEAALTKLDTILEGWIQANPRNIGPNWKCAQETSLRCLNFLLAWRIVNRGGEPAPSASRFVDEHLDRVLPTIGYAIGQANNHAISEAVALFVGGEFLRRYAGEDFARRAARYSTAGRRLLERAVNSLVMGDGTFAQYSVVYHRMVLSLLGFAEIFRRDFQAAPFSQDLIRQARAAVEWLDAMVEPATGHVPNLGANDGTFLFNLDNADYRDFRPSIDLASAMFCNFTRHSGSRLLDLFEPGIPRQLSSHAGSRSYPDGGFLSARVGLIYALLRIPRFAFRPSHADGLHLDVWHGSANVVRDGGTFSYADTAKNALLGGAAGHSTAEFDRRDQMPRLGRFLFGGWLNADVEAPVVTEGGGTVSFGGSYRDAQGALHGRQVSVGHDEVMVEDRLEGFKREARVRFRLMPGNWKLDGSTARLGRVCIEVKSDSELQIILSETIESLHYLDELPVPLLEILTDRAATVTTRISFNQAANNQ